MNLLVLGPQGAGKGTQAQRIAADYAIPHVSTGDIFRHAVAHRTPLGLEVEPILASGTLVPDGITIELIRERLGEEDTRGGFVLDGFPRNTAQAEALGAMLEQIGRRLDAVLFFELSDEIATERLLERSAKEGRADDQPAAIARRLATYHAETEPLVGYYRGARVLVPLAAERTIPEVYAEVQAVLAGLEERA